MVRQVWKSGEEHLHKVQSDGGSMPPPKFSRVAPPLRDIAFLTMRPDRWKCTQIRRFTCAHRIVVCAPRNSQLG